MIVDDDDIEIEDMTDRHSADEHQSEGGDCKSSVINHDLPGSCSSCPSLCDHSQDYGYASAENNNHSNSTSSPDGSDVACSEGFCNHSGNLVIFLLKNIKYQIELIYYDWIIYFCTIIISSKLYIIYEIQFGISKY